MRDYHLQLCFLSSVSKLYPHLQTTVGHVFFFKNATNEIETCECSHLQTENGLYFFYCDSDKEKKKIKRDIAFKIPKKYLLCVCGI